MPRRHSYVDKMNAFVRLRQNRGNIALTHAETGIPKRTLYAWRHELIVEAALGPRLPLLQPSDPNTSLDPFEPVGPDDHDLIPITDDMDEDEMLAALHDNLIAQIGRFGARVTSGLELASPYQRVLALSELLRNLKTLRETIDQRKPERGVRVEFVDYNDGSVSPIPPWQKDDPDDEF